MQTIRLTFAATLVLVASAIAACAQEATGHSGTAVSNGPTRGEDLGRVPGQPSEDGDIAPPMEKSPRASDQAVPGSSVQGRRDPTDPASKSEDGGPLGRPSGSATGTVGSAGD
jgi:hypothetical protein